MRNGPKIVVGLFLVIFVVAAVVVRSAMSKGENTGEDRRLVGSRALMFSEELVWTLEGECLKDAERVLSEENAKKIASSAEGVEGGAERIESRLREYLRVRRNPDVWKLAEKAFVTMTPLSRAATNDAAIAKGLRPVDILAEWMTTDGAKDLVLMTRVYNDKANLKKTAGAVVDTFFADGAPAPAADKGVKVVSRDDRKIVVDLFGGKVVEEWTGEGAVAGEDVKLVWKSNYQYLADVVSGGAPKPQIEDTLVKSDDGYGVEYQEIVGKFLKGADKLPWATILCTKGVMPLGEAVINATKGDDEKKDEKK